MKTFSFPENSISEKYLFSGNAFTRTKRSRSQVARASRQNTQDKNFENHYLILHIQYQFTITVHEILLNTTLK